MCLLHATLPEAELKTTFSIVKWKHVFFLREVGFIKQKSDHCFERFFHVFLCFDNFSKVNKTRTIYIITWVISFGFTLIDLAFFMAFKEWMATLAFSRVIKNWKVRPVNIFQSQHKPLLLLHLLQGFVLQIQKKTWNLHRVKRKMYKIKR